MSANNAETFWNNRTDSERWNIGDDLTLDCFDWMDWLDDKPSREFMRRLCELSDNWEQTK